MARRSGIKIGVFLVLVTMIWVQCSLAQPSSCTPAIVSLAPCLGFITGNVSAATSSCCTNLAGVVQSQARCLCTVLNGGASQLGIIVNQTQALTLPGACKIKTPPLSQCNAAAGPPAGSPQAAPLAPASPVTPSAAGAPLPAGSAPAPSVPVDIAPTTPSTPADVPPTNPSTPSVPDTPSGSGSKTVPTTTGESSAAESSLKFTFSLSFLLLAASALCGF